MEEYTPNDTDELMADGAMQLIDPSLPQLLTILPLSQRPIFPGTALPMTFSGREKLMAIRIAVEQHDGFIGAVLEREADVDDYRESDYHEVGTVYQILKVMPMGNDALQVLGRTVRRFRLQRVVQTEPSLRWRVQYDVQPSAKPDPELKAYMLAISSDIKSLLALNPLFQEQVNMVVTQLNYEKPGQTIDVISNLVSSEKEKLQELLETWDISERAKKLLEIIKDELQVAKIQSRINKQIEDGVSAKQKEYFLREQLSAIRRELGEEQDEGDSIKERILGMLEGKELPNQVREVFDREVSKLESLNTQSPEFNVTRTYLETLAGLPWGVFNQDTNDIAEARRILDEDHYNLEDVKDNILEFLATIIKRASVAGSVICLVGPPGVGKTSIGQSIARALGRKFYRFSVGGMRDEAEIKGHRRTYIGALPGKLIQALDRSKTSNPVILIDEIDKLGSGQGDPASALLEVLDPEQNETFVDHYLDVPFDLSNVLFLTTANQLDTIPGPLLDRMEVIRLSGYIKEEKIKIAQQYLIPKQLREHGFATDEVTFTDGALDFLVDRYAREAGVRNLEKQLRKIIRKLVLKQAETDQHTFEVTAESVEEMLGRPRFTTEKLYDKPLPGVVLGLAYTSLGGATLYIEARGVPVEKNGSFRLTGQLGDVMKESAQIALSYVRSILPPDRSDYFDKYQVHLHVPAGATPKDGPSAGITMALSLYTLATDQAPIDNLAMTGELTLTGRVLPIGGVKEKTIGARRVGITTLIFPEDNRQDFEDLDDYIKEGITAHFARTFNDVLAVAT